MALPTPVLSDGDIVEVHSSSYESARLIWKTWSQDPIKVAILRSIITCRPHPLYYSLHHRWIVSVALGQNRVSPLHYSSLKVHYLNDYRIPKKLVISSLSWIHIVAPGGHSLAISMFNRKVLPGVFQFNIMDLLMLHVVLCM